LASLAMGAWGLNFTEKHFPGIIGMHGVNAFPLFPLYAVACFYLLDFLLGFLTRSAPAGEAGALPAKKFSPLPLLSLTLSCAGFYLPFVSMAGILAGHAARRQEKKGQRLRGIGMANVGLITGYLFLAIWIYMAIISIFIYAYAIFFARG